MEIKQLLSLRDKLNNEYSEIENDCLKNGLSWDEMCKKTHKIKEKLFVIDKQIRQIEEPIIEYGKVWKGEIFSINEFKENALNNALTDNDGYGYYATETSKSNILVYPSDFLLDIYRTDFTHIIWFSK